MAWAALQIALPPSCMRAEFLISFLKCNFKLFFFFSSYGICLHFYLSLECTKLDNFVLGVSGMIKVFTVY